MKFAGKVGFWVDDQEVKPGVFKSGIVEMPYTGDILRNNRGFQYNGDQNGEFTISNKVSILADMFCKANYASIKYVELDGQKITAKNVELNYPRIYIELGGVYNV